MKTKELIKKIEKYKGWRLINQPDGEIYNPSFMGEMFGLDTAIRVLKGDLEILEDGKVDDKKILKRLGKNEN